MVETLENIQKFFLSPAGGLNIFGRLLKIGLIYIILKMIINAINMFIDSTFEKKLSEDESSLSVRRHDTIVQTFKKAIKAILYFFFVLMVLETFNIDTRSILATAGIGGVAIGFGAQSLVKDVINGFFILQDNSYVVGDHVEIQEKEGIVEELSLRKTKVRAFAGELYTIPNGEIQLITNYSRGANRAIVNVEVAYEEDLDKSISVLKELCEDIYNQFNKDLVSIPSIDGVDELGPSGVIIRISAMVKNGNHLKVERAIRKSVKESLEKENIEIPYQKVITINE